MPTAFSTQMNWDREFQVERSYLTDILTGEDGTEQRISLRKKPRERWSYNVTTAEPVDQAWLDALLTAGQTEDWAVPYWPDATPLTIQVSAAATATLTVSTTVSRRLVVGQRVMLYLNDRTTLLCPILSKTGTTIVVTGVTGTWPAARTLVVPAWLGIWSSEQTSQRLSRALSDVSVSFDMYPVDPVVTASTAAALFTVALVNRRDGATDTVVPSRYLVDNFTYGFKQYGRATLPTRTRQLAVTLEGRATVAALEAWFDALRGAWKTFYIDSGQQDLVPTVAPVGTSVTVTSTGYTSRLFPIASRKSIGFVSWDGTVDRRTVTAAVDNGNGTETLTISGSALAGTYARISYVPLVRLSNDTLSYIWLSSQLVETSLEITEVDT